MAKLLHDSGTEGFIWYAFLKYSRDFATCPIFAKHEPKILQTKRYLDKFPLDHCRWQ